MPAAEMNGERCDHGPVRLRHVEQSVDPPGKHGVWGMILEARVRMLREAVGPPMPRSVS